MFQNIRQLILKMTKDCNLRCKYCYILNKDEFKDQMMTFDFYKKVVDKIISDLKLSDTSDQFEIIFHGGEPTLAGTALLRKCFEYARASFKEVKNSLRIGIQTNLTLIDEDMCFLFREYSVSVGCSYDGFKSSNSLRSLVKDSVFINKINLLKKYNVQFGFLTVITSKNYKIALKNSSKLLKKYFNSECNIKMNIVEDVLNANSAIEINGKIMFESIVKKSIIHWIKTGKIKDANTLEYITRFVTSRVVFYNKHVSATCGTQFCGAGMNIVELEPDGNALFCGRYSKFSSDVKSSYLLENDFLELKKYKRFFDKTYEHNKFIIEFNCDQCHAQYVCTSGCEAFHYAKYNCWGIRKEIVCDFYKPLVKWMLINEEKIIERFVKSVIENKINFLNVMVDDTKNNPYLKKYLDKYNSILNYNPNSHRKLQIKSRENMNKENISKENISKENISNENISNENISKE